MMMMRMVDQHYGSYAGTCELGKRSCFDDDEGEDGDYDDADMTLMISIVANQTCLRALRFVRCLRVPKVIIVMCARCLSWYYVFEFIRTHVRICLRVFLNNLHVIRLLLLCFPHAFSSIDAYIEAKLLRATN